MVFFFGNCEILRSKMNFLVWVIFFCNLIFWVRYKWIFFCVILFFLNRIIVVVSSMF